MWPQQINGACFCCGQNNSNTSGCFNCNPRTVCSCGAVLACGTHFAVKEHRCPDVKNTTTTIGSVTYSTDVTASVTVGARLWPYGPPDYHQACCLLHAGGLNCDCAASAADDTEWGRQA